MRAKFRFRVRTLLIAITAVVLAGGAVRWWYDWRMAEYQRQLQIVNELPSGVAVIWGDGVGPKRPDHRPLYARPIHLYWDESSEFDSAATQLEGLTDLIWMHVLGRQIVPHARIANAGQKDEVIETLRRHPSLRRLSVDASIRGTPAEFNAPIYTREDLALLRKLLPKLEIEWIEAN